MNNSVSTMSGKTKLKIVLLGNQAVGKSSIIEKYVKDLFDQTSNPTVGIDFLVKNVTHKGKAFRLQLWDTAGQQRFRSLIPNYLKDAKCALIVIDVTNPASLSSAQSWLQLYNDNKTGEGFAFLIGNKIDLDYREVSKEQAKKKAEQLGIPYYQLSAKTGENIDSLFYKLIQVSQDSSGSSVAIQENSDKKQKKEIKQIAQQQEDETKNKKNTTVNKGNVSEDAQKTTVVLKNQKLTATKEKKKNNGGCC